VTKSLLSEDQLRRQIRIRLADGRLQPTTVGVYKVYRGSGRHCVVCLHEIAPNQDQYEVRGIGGVLLAHKACYVLWHEESVSAMAPKRP